MLLTIQINRNRVELKMRNMRIFEPLSVIITKQIIWCQNNFKQVNAERDSTKPQNINLSEF